MASPTPNYSTDPVEESFRRALTFLSEPWVLQFLFPSHTNYLDQLQQSLLQPHRITADMMITTLNPVDPFSLDEKIRFLLLPSFSTGSISVSYQVTHYVKTNISLYSAPYLGRTARDDVNGIFLTVAELPGTGLTELSCCSQFSPGFRDHVFMILETQAFRDVMHGLSHGFDSEKMKAAYIYTFHSCEIRRCSTCGQQSVACACPLRLVKKKHPLDFDADLHNLSSYLGSYDGVSLQTVYEGGVNMYNGMCSTRASVHFSFDNDRRRQLETWALQHTLSEKTMNLMKLAMPAVVTAQESTDHRDVNIALSYGDRVVVNEKDGVLTCSPLSDDTDNRNVQSERFMSDGHAQEVMEFSRLGSDHTRVMGGNQRGHTASSTTLQERNRLEEASSLGDSNVSSRNLQPTSNQTVNCTEPIPEKQQSEVSHFPQVVTTSPIAASQLGNQLVEQPIQLVFNNDDITRPKRMGRPPAPKIRTVARLVPIVPATNATATAGVQKAINALSEEARRKVALRKARNRASAMRSNERKKKQIQELKDCLEEAKNQEATLRDKERSLRQTNLELKAKLTRKCE